MRLIRMHGLTFARLWKKKRERERKKQKMSHSEVVQNVSFFGISADSINFISVQESIRDSDFESVGREEEKKMGEEEDRSLYVYMCVCVWEEWIASPATGWQLIYMYAATFAVTSILIIRPSLLSSSEPFLLFVPVRHRKARTSSRKNRCVGRLAERFTWNYAPIKIGFSERVLLTNASTDLCGINCF